MKVRQIRKGDTVETVYRLPLRGSEWARTYVRPKRYTVLATRCEASQSGHMVCIGVACAPGGVVWLDSDWFRGDLGRCPGATK